MDKQQEFLLYSKFLCELKAYYYKQKSISCVNQDIRYFLESQQARLNKYNLTLRLDYESEGNVYNANMVANTIPVVNQFECMTKFNESIYYQRQNIHKRYFFNNKLIYSKNAYITLYETIISADEQNQHLQNSTYCCPNCGAISTLKTLQQEGCPYCKTSYLMSDLYPKITNFYMINDGSVSNQQLGFHKRFIAISAIVLSLIQNIYYVLHDSEGIYFVLVTFFIGAGIWAFLLYLLTSFWYLIRLLKQGKQSLTILHGSKGTKKRITKQLTPLDPNFDYEYFEGKVVSLLRMVMFAKQPDTLVQFQGAQLDHFDNVLDIAYHGGFGITSLYIKDEYVYLVLNVYITETRFENGNIKESDEVIELSMQHYCNHLVNREFSILKVNCPHCGASFDARKHHHCPYCKEEYDVGSEDWMVTKVVRK